MFRRVVLGVWECFFLAECTVQFIILWLFFSYIAILVCH